MKTTVAEFQTAETTGIGSLPHHNMDAAIAFSLSLSLPFLPQIPIRNPWEYMIPQALEGLPGLQVDATNGGDGGVLLDIGVWLGRSRGFQTKLDSAFERAPREATAFEAFEPSPASTGCWQPFLWELEERAVKRAKVQICGPLTAQWALRATDGTSLDTHPELSTQVFKLVTARALAMTRLLRSTGVAPVVYLDEPGLFALDLTTPRHQLALQELRIAVQALKNETVVVGLHCCSNTEWDAVLALPIDILSIDSALSLGTLLSRKDALLAFLARGGRLSLGVIPTALSEGAIRGFEPGKTLADLVDRLQAGLGSPALARETLARAIFTPACGLALHTTSDAEDAVQALGEFRKLLQRALHTPA